MAPSTVRSLLFGARRFTYSQNPKTFSTLADVPAFCLSSVSTSSVNILAAGAPICLAVNRQTRSYSKKVHEHFFNPRNAGAFDLSDPEMKSKVGTAVVGKAACGDVIKLQVLVEDGKITDARFKTFGCGSAIASSSYATELIKGKTCDDALKVKNTDIAEYLNLPPVKVHCSLLAQDAVRHAILDYQKKQKGSTTEGSSASPVSPNVADAGEKIASPASRE